MKLKKDFITHKTGEGEVLLAVGEEAKNFHGIVKLNPTAAEIVEMLKEDTTEEKIIEAFQKEYPQIQKDILKNDIHSVLQTLKEVHALEE